MSVQSQVPGSSPAPAHTPGPWHYTDDGFVIYHGGGEDAFSLATLSRSDHRNGQIATIPREELLANAQLIAAAPDLLAACKYALLVIEPCGAGDHAADDPCVHCIITAAIAKAAPAA